MRISDWSSDCALPICRPRPYRRPAFRRFLRGEAMAKKITGYVKLQVKAAQANPSPPIGPALGQRGVNIMEFCKQFNAATQGIEPGRPRSEERRVGQECVSRCRSGWWPNL